MVKLPLFLFPVLLAVAHGWAQEAPAPAPATPPPRAVPTVEQIFQADATWKELEKETPTLNPPPEWKSNQPPAETVKAWIPKEAERLLALGGRLHDFALKFSFSEQAGDAWTRATAAYFAAAQLHYPRANEKLAAIDAERLAMPGVAKEEAFQIRLRQVQFQSSAVIEKSAAEIAAAGGEGSLAARKIAEAAETEAKKLYIQGAYQLVLEFPERPEPFAMLLEVAGEGSSADGKAILMGLVGDQQTPAGVRQRAQDFLSKLDMLGKPVNLRFTASDGRLVDLSLMKGKVVLIDFWATWCGPCLKMLPELKASYAELQKNNFEIVGISFDKERDRLEAFVQENSVPWPQYFDGLESKNEIGRRFAISSLPTMWLVDKKGLLRDLHAETNLAEKVKTLLDEK